MEERAGFEPADGGTVTGFQDRLFQPLRHLSIIFSFLIKKGAEKEGFEPSRRLPDLHP